MTNQEKLQGTKVFLDPHLHGRGDNLASLAGNGLKVGIALSDHQLKHSHPVG